MGEPFLSPGDVFALGGVGLRVCGRVALGAGRILGNEIGAVGGGITRLFRAVEPAELEDIVAKGVFRNPAGSEVKYFSTTIEGAAREARLLSKIPGAGPFTIVETTIPRQVLESLPAGNILSVAAGVRTVVVPTVTLRNLSTPRIFSSIPLP